MGALLTIFRERPSLDCSEKVEANFALGLGSWLGCNGQFARLYTLSRNYNSLVGTIVVWGPVW
jgi:hypothetical protein